MNLALALIIVSEMTYNVSMGTLNPTIPYLALGFLELRAIFICSRDFRIQTMNIRRKSLGMRL